MKTVTVKKLVSKGVWNLLKVLENYGYNGNRWMVWESGVDGLAFGPQISSSEATTYNIPIFRV